MGRLAIQLIKEVGEEIIVYPRTQNPLTIDVNTINNAFIGDNLSDLSQTVTIVLTPELDVFLDNISEFGFEGTPALHAPIEAIISTGDETILVGTAIIEDYDQEERLVSFEIASGVIPLEEAIGDKLMSEATGWPEATYNMQTFLDQQAATEAEFRTQRFFIPFVDRGHDPDGRPRIPTEIARITDQTYINEYTTTGVTRPDSDPFSNTQVSLDGENYFNQSVQDPNTGRTGGIQPDQTFLTPTAFHGEIAFGQGLQGYITSHTTPLRIEQLPISLSFKECMDRLFELAGSDVTYEADFLEAQIEEFTGGELVQKADGTNALFAAYSSFGDITTGTADVFSLAGDYINMQSNNLDRSLTSVLLDETNAGRAIYSTRDDGLAAFFVGILRSDNAPGDNGARDRWRIDRGTNSAQDQQEIRDNVNPGDRIIVADVDDARTRTSFLTLAGPSMFEDLTVTPITIEGHGIPGVADSVDLAFRATEANFGPLEIAQNTTSGKDTVTLIQHYFGQEGAVTQVIANDNFNTSTGVYEIREPGSYTFRFEGDFTIFSETQSGRQYNNHQVQIVKVNESTTSISFGNPRNRDTVLESFALPQIDSTTFAENDYAWDFEHTANFRRGDKVAARLVSVSHKGNDSIRVNFTGLQFGTTRIPKQWENAAIDFGALFGDTKGIDLLQAMRTRANLVIYPSKTRRKHYIVRNINDAIRNANRHNFSGRLFNKVETSPLQDQEKIITFSGEEGSDRFNVIAEEAGQRFGNHIHESNDDGITQGDKEIGGFFVPLINANPNVVGDQLRRTYINARNGIPHLYALDDTEQTSVEAGILIGYNKPVTVPPFFYELNGITRAFTQGNVRTISSLRDDQRFDINWAPQNENQRNLAPRAQWAFETYYGPQFNHLFDLNNIKITADVILSPEEYQEINWNDTIHEYGTDYLINNISGFPLQDKMRASIELISYRNNLQTVFEVPDIRYLLPIDPDERTYTVGIQIIGYDGPVSDGVLFTNPVIQQDRFTATVVGEGPATNDGGGTGTLRQITVNVMELPGFETASSNWQDNITAPAGVSNVVITNGLEGGLIVAFQIEVQDLDMSTLLVIRGEVDRETIGNTEFDIDWTQIAALTTAGVSLADLGATRGAIDGESTILATFSPPDGQSLDSNTFDIVGALPEGVISVTFDKFGTSVLATARVRFQPTNVVRSIQVTGTDPTQLAEGTQTSLLTLDFMETLANVTTIDDLSIRGVVGTGSMITVPAYAADLYELLRSSFSATITDTDGAVVNYARMENATGGGESIGLPISITQWPAEDTVLNIRLNGVANLIGAETVTVTVNTVGAPAGASLTEATETFMINKNVDFQYTNSLIPDQGNQLVGDVTAVETTDDDNVVTGLAVNNNRYGANVNMTINSRDEGGTATVTIGAVVGLEPHVMTLNLSESLPLGKLSSTSFAGRFGEGDVSVRFNGITIRPIGNHQYSGTQTFVPTGASVVANSYSYADGAVTFDITVPVPTSDARFTMTGDVTVDVHIPGVEPGLGQATAATFGMALITVPNMTETTISTGVLADGRWRVISSGSIASLGVDGTILASSETSLTGQVEITIPELDTMTRFTIARLESFNGGVTLATIQIIVSEPGEVETGGGGSVTQEWNLIPSYSGGLDTAQWTWTDTSGTARTTILTAPQEDTTVVSVGRPVQTVGTGGREIPGDIVGNITGTATNAIAVGGMTFLYVPAGDTPATVPADTIYFEYE